VKNEWKTANLLNKASTDSYSIALNSGKFVYSAVGIRKESALNGIEIHV
jgi:hypothetical protein